MRTDSIKQLLQQAPELRSRLFAMGFYATNKRCDAFAYPFYGIWKEHETNGLVFYVHPRQHVYSCEANGVSLVLIGHAYDPVHMIASEDAILQKLAQTNEPEFYEEICSLTGVYTLLWKKNGGWRMLGDAAGMQTAFYAAADGEIHVASHINLIGDMLGVEMSPYARELSSYRFYKLLGNYFPGDTTQFEQVKRLVPNHYVEFSGDAVAQRFHTPEIKSLPYDEIVQQAAQLLHNNLKLIAEKWPRPAISMTGGCDSKTTLACASGLYDRFSYFSYVSSEDEAVDSQAAHVICGKVLDNASLHHIYTIPSEDSAFPDIESQRYVMWYNCGCTRRNNLNDVRKRCFFANLSDFDVEVKSWASEIGRAYYSKRFNNRTKFPAAPTPRMLTTMCKFFLYNRKLVRQTDKIFRDYLSTYPLNSKTIPWLEQLFWEFRVSSWNGTVITGEHRYSFDITIPYNNCTLLELLLSVPLEDRIADKLYKDIRTQQNALVDGVGIHVQNVKHTDKRALLENVYFTLHSSLPCWF